MSTATKPQAKPRTVSIAPAPCRMIRVEVIKDTGNPDFPFAISWLPVVGIASAPSLEFPDHIDVWPVVVGDTPWAGELCVADEKYDVSNLAYRTVVPCYWPPEHDQENAVRIGKKLIESEGEIGNWVSIPRETAEAAS
jgi:hypothetical protein